MFHDMNKKIDISVHFVPRHVTVTTGTFTSAKSRVSKLEFRPVLFYFFSCQRVFFLVLSTTIAAQKREHRMSDG